MSNPPILDVCCGSRCFYFDKHDTRVLACAPVRPLFGAETPKTSLTHFAVFAKDGATEARDGLCILRPQRIKDFCALPFAWQDQYDVVVFEPPMLLAPGWTPG